MVSYTTRTVQQALRTTQNQAVCYAKSGGIYTNPVEMSEKAPRLSCTIHIPAYRCVNPILINKENFIVKPVPLLFIEIQRQVKLLRNTIACLADP